MKLKDFFYLSLAFITVRFWRRQKPKSANKIPAPDKIMDHAAPPRGNGIEPGFNPEGTRY